MLLQRHNYTLNFFRIFCDILSLCICWLFSFGIRFDAKIISAPKGFDSLSNMLVMLPLIFFSYMTIFIIGKTYNVDTILDRKKIWDEYFSLLKKHIVAFFFFVSLSFFLYEHRYSRIALAIFFFLAPIFLFLGRMLFIKLKKNILKQNNKKKKVMIIGTGPAVQKIVKEVLMQSHWNLELIASSSFSEMVYIQKQFWNDSVDIAFIIPNADESAYLNEIYKHLDQTLVEIIVVPFFGEKVIFDPKAFKMDGITMIALNTSNFDQFGATLKRTFDIIFSLVFIVIFFPVFLICALLVKISSSGPIFYKQERMGIDGHRFMCLKFRGMYINAESYTGPIWAKANDNRTTKIGKWLRRTSLDEIPQFFNVLQGNMSVVGPRPERPVFVESFKTQIPGYMLRHKVKAGITGWAQINGWRGNTSLERRIECDLWYVQNWSIWLDIKIVLLTPLRGFIHPNAY